MNYLIGKIRSYQCLAETEDEQEDDVIEFIHHAFDKFYKEGRFKEVDEALGIACDQIRNNKLTLNTCVTLLLAANWAREHMTNYDKLFETVKEHFELEDPTKVFNILYGLN